MKTKSFLLWLAVIPMLSIAQLKPGKYMPANPPIPPPVKMTYESAPNDPLNARIYTLSNGLKIYLSVYKNAPRIQTYIAVKAGSKNDPANATGLAHYLEHMLFKGTDQFGTKDFSKEKAEINKIQDLYEVYRTTTDVAQRKSIYHNIDSISGVAAKYAIANEYDKMLAAIGANGTNAFTSFDQTVYVNDIPSNQINNWLRIEGERFRNPVLRLFHTELEAVYEEKNRGLDSDNRKLWEALFSGMFRNHTYGTQTTIGTIEHLKNPSMLEISKYYNANYVPNNMAIIMSGDFDPEKVVADVNLYFGTKLQKPVLSYSFQPEPAMTQKVVKEVLGPDPENIAMAWRTTGEGTHDGDIANIITSLLYNNTAGLLDLNLNQAQKVLKSESFYYGLKDYGMVVMMGTPKEGQKLEEVENLFLNQIEIIKAGKFPDWLLPAVVTDLKLKRAKDLENNGTRTDIMMNAFVNDIPWKDYANYIDRLSKITKDEIIEYARKNFSENNYVVVYKRIGEDKSVVKVEKPAITPVDVDRENTSMFVKKIMVAPVTPIEPKFLEYSKDILKNSTKSGIPILYNKNTENNLFQLYYHFDMGSNNGKILPLAVKLIPFIGNAEMSAAQVKEEMYKMGCAFEVFCDAENIWINLSGLSDNFEKASKLLGKLLSNPAVDETVFKNFIGDQIKERKDNKLQKRVILQRAMVSFARYGTPTPFSNVFSDDELNKLSVNEVKNSIAYLLMYDHKIMYYGPAEINAVTRAMDLYHGSPEKLKPVFTPYKFEEKVLDKTVYVVDYDMKQAEIVMLSNGESYKPENVPVINLYNNYFGGGMSGVLFQDLRESKALAYSTFSQYRQPSKLWKKYFNFSYIGSQADKLGEAMKGLSDLLNEMPKAEESFKAAKESLIQQVRTQRITKADIFFNYLEAQNLGLTSDIRKEIFAKVPALNYTNMADFHKQFIKGKPLTTLVLGKKENLDLKILESYGKVKFLTLEEIFGY